MKDHITVYWNGQGITIQTDFARLKNLKNGYRVKTEAEFWEILSGHCGHQIPKMEMMINAESKPKQN